MHPFPERCFESKFHANLVSAQQTVWPFKRRIIQGTIPGEKSVILLLVPAFSTCSGEWHHNCQVSFSSGMQFVSTVLFTLFNH